MLAAICDDAKADREKVGEFLAQKMKSRGESLQIKYFDRGEDLIEEYDNGNVVFDMIFMDIYLGHLNGMNGMETVRKIRKYDRKVSVFFMTSCPDYAVESYEVRADGYLLKPVDKEKIEKAVNRFMEERYPRIRQSLLMVNGNTGRRIAYDDIIYIESRGRNLRVVCSGGIEHIIRKKLADVQAELIQPRFLKCNQSFIVNMDYIAYADEDFTMDNGDIIPIKVRERKKIKEQYFTYTLRQEWHTVC